jgi:site-specific DNA-methyltransferase (adenine-specific)
MTVRILQGDCREVMRTLDENSVDAIVTDPPYELTSARPCGRSEATRGKVMGGFMGMKWDGTGVSFDVTTWAEALRVLKPGGYLLAFSGTRTYHRMVCAIEDAGFEIRDQVGWAFGSGFPKSHNGPWGGTALKPAWEPVCMARKPLERGLTVAENFAKWGTGALNIDGCRVLVEDEVRAPITGSGGLPTRHTVDEPRAPGVVAQPHELGRWPANLIHDGSDEVLQAFPQAPGQLAPVKFDAEERKTGTVYGAMKRGHEPSANSDNEGAVGFKMKPGARRLDAGSAARFFYCAKADRADRNDGLQGMPQAMPANAVDRPSQRSGEAGSAGRGSRSKPRENYHPTVKPTDLMRYLCRLVTPSGGLVLDPFMGSGSTLKAAELEGFSAIGIELEPAYIDIARRRIAADAPLFANVETEAA